jgi:hypothetical protein
MNVPKSICIPCGGAAAGAFCLAPTGFPCLAPTGFLCLAPTGWSGRAFVSFPLQFSQAPAPKDWITRMKRVMTKKGLGAGVRPLQFSQAPAPKDWITRMKRVMTEKGLRAGVRPSWFLCSSRRRLKVGRCKLPRIGFEGGRSGDFLRPTVASVCRSDKNSGHGGSVPQAAPVRHVVAGVHRTTTSGGHQ